MELESKRHRTEDNAGDLMAEKLQTQQLGIGGDAEDLATVKIETMLGT